MPRFLQRLGLDTLPLRAAALTYYSFLALIPLGALAIALLEMLRLFTLSQEVKRFFLSQMGLLRDTSHQVSELLTRADAALVGSLSVLLLLLSATALLLNVEAAFNEIWHVQSVRKLWQRALLFLGVLLIGPIGLGVSLTLTSAWRSSQFGHLHLPGLTLALGPTALVFVILFLLYRWAPNAHVSTVAAIAGALVAAPGWELAKQVYTLLAAQTYRQNALIYGALAAIPILLLWIQLSWIIVLLGGRLTYWIQEILGK